MRLRMHLHQPTKRYQSGFSAIEVLLVVLVIAALVVTSVVVYQRYKSRTKSTAATNTSQTTTQKQESTVIPAQHPDPYAGWMSYTSSFEKLSFRYPSNWVAVDTSGKIGVAGDSLQLTSPAGSLTVSWFSAILGLGGACDATIMPGTTVSAGALSPCPYWYVIDKQKLSGADLYYVAGVETNDGKTYAPWCALQSSDGI